MAQTLPVYAIAALLLAASSGPVLQSVRDASLADFEALDEWRSLDEFPFLEQVLPYLPPLVVDWVVVQHEAPEGLPPGVDYRFDDRGRMILVWPDGCEETQERYETRSTCDPPEDDDPCTLDPTAAGCDPCSDPANDTEACRPPECPPGQTLDPDWPEADPACVPDPRCTEGDNGTRPADCPPPEEPPRPLCGDGQVEAYDGTCVPVTWTLLRNPVFQSGDGQTKTFDIELKVPYAMFWINVSWEGLANPGHSIKLYNTANGENICWETEDGGPPGSDDGCHPQRSSGLATSGTRNYRDTWDGPIPPQNLTLWVEPQAAPGGSGTLRVELWGIPYEADDGRDE